MFALGFCLEIEFCCAFHYTIVFDGWIIIVINFVGLWSATYFLFALVLDCGVSRGLW